MGFSENRENSSGTLNPKVVLGEDERFRTEGIHRRVLERTQAGMVRPLVDVRGMAAWGPPCPGSTCE